MSFRAAALLSVALATLAGPGAARAADMPAPAPASPYGWLEEVRIGADDHNAFLLKERPGGVGNVDGAIEFVSRPLPFYSGPGGVWNILLNPRAAVGSTLSFNGNTSVVYADFLWRAPVVGPLFVEGQFGGAYNDSARNVATPNRIDIGCPVTFRESAGVGIQLNEHFDIVADVDHISHANLCGRHNPGLTNIGLKLGYKF